MSYFEGTIPGQYLSVTRRRKRGGESWWQWVVSGDHGGEGGTADSEPAAIQAAQEAKRRLWAFEPHARREEKP